jgi:putative ABC transport system ATP-binding protein
MIRIENLKKTFTQGREQLEILKGVNLTLRSGERAAILGKSGSGKSTLISLIAGLMKADSGKIFWGDQEILALSEKELNPIRARNLGLVFQQFHLFPYMTALENVLVPLEIQKVSNPKPRARELLNDLGLLHRENHFPEQLSGGERQRVAIARALVSEPPILLADEPSGNLDEVTGEQMLTKLFEVTERKGTTLILVTHDQDLAKRCDRQLWLEGGILQ